MHLIQILTQRLIDTDKLNQSQKMKNTHNLMHMHDIVKVVHSYREANSCVDNLVKAGIDSM